MMVYIKTGNLLMSSFLGTNTEKTEWIVNGIITCFYPI